MYLPNVTEEYRARKLEEAKQWGWFVFILEWIKIKIFKRRKVIVEQSDIQIKEEEVKLPTFGNIFTEAKAEWDNADEEGKQLILLEHKANKSVKPKEFKGELFEGLGTKGSEIG